MKKLDTSAVTSISWMPLLANDPSGPGGIDFLQQAYSECLTGLAGFLVADQTKVTIMYGCGISGGTVSAGWVFYRGELYYAPGGTFTFPPSNAYLNANIYLNSSSADPTYFSDGTTHTVHIQREIRLTATGTANAGNVPDYGSWCTISSNSSATPAATAVLSAWLTSTYSTFSANYNKWAGSLSPVPIQVGTTGAPSFLNGWNNDSGIANVGTPSPLMFYKIQGRVYIWGEITHPGSTNFSTIFHLPPGYYPASTEEVFNVPDIGLLTPGGSGYTSQPPPVYTIWINNGGAVTFLGAGSGTFSISLSGINYLAAPDNLALVMEMDTQAQGQSATS
jgi:hypothetical protein